MRRMRELRFISVSTFEVVASEVIVRVNTRFMWRPASSAGVARRGL